MQDQAPVLDDDNQIIVQIYYQARVSGIQIQGKKKTESYLRPSDVYVLMVMHHIDEEDRPHIMRWLQDLQDIENNLRPGYPIKSQPRNRGR